MKKLCIIFMIVLLTGCGNEVQVNNHWGSFTSEKTFSYDNAFCALQSVEDTKNGPYIVVDIYDVKTDKKIHSFTPARASDFWGICWEETTYNIWIQSADVGVLCYEYKDNCWNLNENAVRPKGIISKYD